MTLLLITISIIIITITIITMKAALDRLVKTVFFSAFSRRTLEEVNMAHQTKWVANELIALREHDTCMRVMCVCALGVLVCGFKLVTEPEPCFGRCARVVTKVNLKRSCLMILEPRLLGVDLL